MFHSRHVYSERRKASPFQHFGYLSCHAAVSFGLLVSNQSTSDPEGNTNMEPGSISIEGMMQKMAIIVSCFKLDF